MFSTPEFIEASRSFVCVRIETYENKENEKLIRSILNGRYANTAFCVFDPQGRRRLSRSGRSPNQVLGGRGDTDNATIIAEMNQIAARYRPKTDHQDVVLQDFLSFRQALNVASADQRLLVFVNADKPEAKKIMPTLQELFADEDIVGRFHLDIAGKEDRKWTKAVKGAKAKPAINIIRAGKFGLDGELMTHLPIDSSFEDLKSTLLAANAEFSSSETRKVYSDHVMQGKRNGINYETEIPYGEDRDGDGEIDKRARRGGSGSGGARPGGMRSGGRGRGRRRPGGQ